MIIKHSYEVETINNDGSAKCINFSIRNKLNLYMIGLKNKESRIYRIAQIGDVVTKMEVKNLQIHGNILNHILI